MLLFNYVARIFGGIGLLVLLYFGIGWLWRHPESLNPTARRYRTHTLTLQADSVQSRRIIASRDSTIVSRDTTIRRFQREASQAQAFGLEWKNRYTAQVVVTDAGTDRLTDSQRELAYYKALRANGTLSAIPVGPLTPASPQVVTAGLKTAGREVVARLANDTLGRALGRMQAANARLASGLGAAAAAAKPGGFFIGRAKRAEKRVRAVVAKALWVPDTLGGESELEKYENRKR